MEGLVEVTLKKVHILLILNCYYKLFPLVYIGFDSEGLTIQGSCEERRILATKVIPRNSVEGYECREPAVAAIPNCIKRMGGQCESIAILRVDSWRVKSVFTSNNGVSYEAISHTMHKLLTQPRLDSGISFERYATTEIVKCGFWGKLPLFDHFCGAPTQ